MSNITKKLKKLSIVDGVVNFLGHCITRAQWWSTFGASAPHLQKFVIRVLSFTCSDTSCERNWGVFQHLHTKKRNRLAQERLNDMVYMKFNSALHHRHMKEGAADCIMLEKVDDNNEWLMGRMEEEGLDGDENIPYDLVGRCMGAYEPTYATRASRASYGASTLGTTTNYNFEDEVEADVGVSGNEGDERVPWSLMMILLLTFSLSFIARYYYIRE